MSSTERKERLGLALGVLISSGLVQWMYVSQVAVSYAYLGFQVYSRPFWLPLLFTVLSLLPTLWLPTQVRRPSGVVVWVLYLLVVMPAIGVTPYGVDLSELRLLGLASVMLSSFFMLHWMLKLPLLRIARPAIPPSLYWVGVGTIAISFLLLIVRTFGLRLEFVALVDVYSVREEYKDVVSSVGIGLAYIVGWTSNAIAPLFVAVGLRHKRILLLVTGILIQLLVYSFTGHKTVLFSFLFLGFLLFCLRDDGRGLGLRFVWGVTAGIVTVIAYDYLTGGILMSSLFVRRLFIVPGLLTGMYADFFSSNPYTFLTQSIFSGFGDYPYSLPIPKIIGMEYFNSPDMSANANIWADAYANFGVVGVYIFILILGLALWVADSIAKRRDWKVACLIVGVPALSLSNSALLTVLLTHGFGLALLLLYLLPPPENRRVEASTPGSVRISTTVEGADAAIVPAT